MSSLPLLPSIATDAWTAIVFVFHDHDWEEFLLPQALAPGALGLAPVIRYPGAD